MLMGSIGGQPQKRMGMLSPTSMIMQVEPHNVWYSVEIFLLSPIVGRLGKPLRQPTAQHGGRCLGEVHGH